MPAARRTWLLAAVVVLCAGTLATAASSGNAPRAGARVLSAPDLRPLTSSSAGVHVGFDLTRSGSISGAFTGVGVQAQAKAAAPAPVTPRVAVPTMSMDAPIQGGLTAHQEQALSARLVRAHADVAIAPKSTSWTPAMGRTAVARAESWVGMPYSWAGGNAAGPTPGRCAVGSGGDLDCHVIGFDCSGLMMYAWGSYLSLPHLADAQRGAGAFHPTVEQLLPGDLVFFAGYLPGGTGHVAIYAGDGMVVEAPQSGSVIKRSPLAELIASDGAYRGAVRPLTAETPTLTAPVVTTPAAGGMVTLRGTHLAGVDAVHLGGVAVRHFAQHSDSTIVFRAPAHAAGVVALTVSTSWQAVSPSVALTYAEPRPVPPVSASPTPTAPKTPAAPTTTAPPTMTAPPTTTAPPKTTSAPKPPVSSSSPAPGPTTSSSTAPRVNPSSGSDKATPAPQPSTTGSAAVG